MKEAKNKQIIEKAKEILEKKGYEVKTGHLYELFSKLAGHSSWNVAKVAGEAFEKVLETFKEELPVVANKQSLTLKDMEELVLSGVLKNKFFMGQSLKTGEAVLKDFYIEPNALFTGNMGIGKTEAIKSVLSSWMMANSETQLFIVDLKTEARAYHYLFEYKQVRTITKSKEQLYVLIDSLYLEASERADKLKLTDSNNLKEYEKNTGVKIPPCLVVIEELDSIVYNELNFDNEFKTPGTTAQKLHALFRIGRSLGIWFVVSAKDASKAGIPPELIPNFSNIFGFSLSRNQSSYLFGEVSERTFEKGLANTSEGEVKFNYFPEDGLYKLTKKFLESKEIGVLNISNDAVKKNKKKNLVSISPSFKHSNPYYKEITEGSKKMFGMVALTPEEALTHPKNKIVVIGGVVDSILFFPIKKEGKNKGKEMARLTLVNEDKKIDVFVFASKLEKSDKGSGKIRKIKKFMPIVIKGKVNYYNGNVSLEYEESLILV